MKSTQEKKDRLLWEELLLFLLPSIERIEMLFFLYP